ncbi:hypothetical protein GCM10008107_21670 [Psychrosphaera saromensis]|jgi:hypothetical protein|uniref:Uncharacterized protein n=1 Tax=Psychrosphaera saromensis TaxID=716813 RepID=A0A2S7USX5_9GAMM|nr:hypothetical protein [Psychrosphaera saromensis]PQJ52848.1 hypothetical protein BTO11_03700 [Psychrosphaera saromensis]GHB71717.1 hypothetical protein GCM10008107_21670 [Psychrosphaera saromensis]GLQ13353.1 hypothetical protein GCM10007917_08080 [Psychrosphaera saromensis]
MNNQETQNDTPEISDHQNSSYQDNYFNLGYFVRWVGISLIIIAGLVYLAYHLGSNESNHKVNELTQEIKRLSDMDSLNELISQFEVIGSNIKLSGIERARLTELLDQVIIHKNSLQLTEVELQQSKNKISNITVNYKDQVARLKREIKVLKAKLAEAEISMSYSQGKVKTFKLNLKDTYALLAEPAEPASRVSLQRILTNEKAQIYVGNSLMSFQIGHTLRFRFVPNWLCNITLIKIDNAAKQVEFEYKCDLN